MAPLAGVFLVGLAALTYRYKAADAVDIKPTEDTWWKDGYQR